MRRSNVYETHDRLYIFASEFVEIPAGTVALPVYNLYTELSPLFALLREFNINIFLINPGTHVSRRVERRK